MFARLRQGVLVECKTDNAFFLAVCVGALGIQTKGLFDRKDALCREHPLLNEPHLR